MNPRARAEARSWDAVEGLRLRPPHTSSAGKSPQKKEFRIAAGESGQEADNALTQFCKKNCRKTTLEIFKWPVK